jgi:hypothetical protein
VASSPGAMACPWLYGWLAWACTGCKEEEVQYRNGVACLFIHIPEAVVCYSDLRVAGDEWHRWCCILPLASAGMRKETVEAGAVVGSPGGEVCRGGKGSEDGLVADRFPVGLVRVRMPVKAVLRKHNRSGRWRHLWVSLPC